MTGVVPSVQVLQQLLPQLLSVQQSNTAYCKLCSTCAQLLLHLLRLITCRSPDASAVLETFIDELLSTCSVFAQASHAGLCPHEETAPLQPFSLFHATLSAVPESQAWTRAQGSSPNESPYLCDAEPLPSNSHAVLGGLIHLLYCMHHLYAEHMHQFSTTLVRLLTASLSLCPVQHLRSGILLLCSLLETAGPHQPVLKIQSEQLMASCLAVLTLDCSCFSFASESGPESLAEAAAECWLLAAATVGRFPSDGTEPAAHAQALAACAMALQRQQTPRLLDMAQQLLRHTASFTALLSSVERLPAAAIHSLQLRRADRKSSTHAAETSVPSQDKVKASPAPHAVIPATDLHPSLTCTDLRDAGTWCPCRKQSSIHARRHRRCR